MILAGKQIAYERKKQTELAYEKLVEKWTKEKAQKRRMMTNVEVKAGAFARYEVIGPWTGCSVFGVPPG